MHVTTVGLDLAKHVFQVHGIDQDGQVLIRRQLRRGELIGFFRRLPPCLIGMEACSGAHHLGRRLVELGHQVRLLPAQYVKPYLKGHKNDYRDAEAIAEAVQRPTMRCVPLKSPEQLDLQALHRVRSRLVTQRTAVINQIRGFLLERGVPVRQGAAALRSALPELLATRSDALSAQVAQLITDLAEDWRYLDARIASATKAIEARVAEDEHCQQLMSAPGVGPNGERDGRRDRNRRRVHRGAALRCLARPGAQAGLDRQPNDPGRDHETRQSLSANLVHPRRASRVAAAPDLAAARVRRLARGGIQASARQRPGRRLGRQTSTHLLEPAREPPPVRPRPDGARSLTIAAEPDPTRSPPRFARRKRMNG